MVTTSGRVFLKLARRSQTCSVSGRRPVSKLALEGLQLGAVTEIFSADFPIGAALTIEPASGTVVTRGALIDLIVST